MNNSGFSNDNYFRGDIYVDDTGGTSEFTGNLQVDGNLIVQGSEVIVGPIIYLGNLTIMPPAKLITDYIQNYDNTNGLTFYNATGGFVANFNSSGLFTFGTIGSSITRTDILQNLDSTPGSSLFLRTILNTGIRISNSNTYLENGNLFADVGQNLTLQTHNNDGFVITDFIIEPNIPIQSATGTDLQLFNPSAKGIDITQSGLIKVDYPIESKTGQDLKLFNSSGSGVHVTDGGVIQVDYSIESQSGQDLKLFNSSGDGIHVTNGGLIQVDYPVESQLGQNLILRNATGFGLQIFDSSGIIEVDKAIISTNGNNLKLYNNQQLGVEVADTTGHLRPFTSTSLVLESSDASKNLTINNTGLNINGSYFLPNASSGNVGDVMALSSANQVSFAPPANTYFTSYCEALFNITAHGGTLTISLPSAPTGGGFFTWNQVTFGRTGGVNNGLAFDPLGGGVQIPAGKAGTYNVTAYITYRNSPSNPFPTGTALYTAIGVNLDPYDFPNGNTHQAFSIADTLATSQYQTQTISNVVTVNDGDAIQLLMMYLVSNTFAIDLLYWSITLESITNQAALPNTGNVSFGGSSSTLNQLTVFDSTDGKTIINVPPLIDLSGNLTNLTSLNGILPAGLTNKVRCLYQPGSLIDPNPAFPRFNLWSDVVNVITNCAGMVDVYISNASVNPAVINVSTDCESRVNFFSYNNNVTGVNVSIPDGVQLTNIATLNGAGLNFVCDSQTMPSLLFSNGNLIKIFYGAQINVSATATQPPIQILDTEGLVLAFDLGAQISNSLNTSIPVVNVGINSTLIFAMLQSTAGPLMNNIISSTDNTATLIKLFDASQPDSLTNTGYTGAVLLEQIDRAEGVQYTDSAPLLGASNVQQAIDAVKSSAGAKSKILWVPGGTPDAVTLINWSDVVTLIGSVDGLLDLYISDQFTTPIINASCDFQNRVTVKPYRELVGTGVQVTVNDGVVISNLGAVSGNIVFNCQASTTTPFTFNNNTILYLFDGASFVSLGSATVPLIDVPTSNLMAILSNSSTNFDNSAVPSVPCLNIGPSASLAISLSFSFGGGLSSTTIGSTDNTATLVFFIDSSYDQTLLTFPAMTGSIAIRLQDLAISVSYNDSLQAPPSGSSDVQGCLDFLKTQIGGGVTFPLLAPDGSQPAPSYSFASSTGTGLWQSAPGFLQFNSNGNAAMQIFNNHVTMEGFLDLNTAPISGANIISCFPTVFPLDIRDSTNTTQIFIGTTTNIVEIKNKLQVDGNVGFYATTPVAQQTSAGSTTYTANLSANIVYSGSTFVGYTITDIVNALRTYGLLA